MKLLFDENIGWPIVRALAGLLAYFDPRPEVKHLLEFTQRQGIPDSQWISQLEGEHWMVITGDRGSRGSGTPLPRICRDAGITHVIIRGRLNNLRQWERARALIVLWPDLVRAYEGPEGREFRLKKGPGKHPVLESA